MTGLEIAAVLGASLLGAFVKSVTGMGYPLLAIPLLTLVLVPVLYRLVEAGKQRRAARREERITRLAAARQGR